MSEDRKRLPVADQIRKGLEEAIRHARGEITLKTTVVPFPGSLRISHTNIDPDGSEELAAEGVYSRE